MGFKIGFKVTTRNNLSYVVNDVDFLCVEYKKGEFVRSVDAPILLFDSVDAAYVFLHQVSDQWGEWKLWKVLYIPSKFKKMSLVRVMEIKRLNYSREELLDLWKRNYHNWGAPNGTVLASAVKLLECIQEG